MLIGRPNPSPYSMGMPQAAQIGAPMEDFPLGQMETVSQPDEAFTWGAGGTRLTPEDIARGRQRAQAMQAAGMDFSPVQHWTQGAARVAQALMGGLDERRLDKAAGANAAHNQAVLEALMRPTSTSPGRTPGIGDGVNNEALLAAMADPTLSPEVQKIVRMQWERANPKPQAKHFFETNSGNQGYVDPATGKVEIIYNDPDPRMQFIPDGMGGGSWAVVPKAGAPSAAQPGSLPPETLPPDFDFGEGGAGSGQPGFR